MDHVNVALEAVTYEDRAQLVAQFEQAIARRQEIDQAKGILIATYRVSSHDAWLLLSTVSQRCNVKVRALSRVLIQIVSHAEVTDQAAEAAARRYLLPADWIQKSSSNAAADRAAAREDRQRAAIEREISADHGAAAERAER